MVVDNSQELSDRRVVDGRRSQLTRTVGGLRSFKNMSSLQLMRYLQLCHYDLLRLLSFL